MDYGKFGKMHFLLISENEFTHEMKRDGITSLHGIHGQLITGIEGRAMA